MAKLYGEIAASGLMTFDKSFARANGQPLDSTEVFYSLAAAETYAAGDVAYIGQKIVVIEDGVVTHYGIEPDNSLKELGSVPIGDDKTVEVVDGKIQLAALDGKGSGTYQPFLVDGQIEWRVPSATTVEGLDSRLKTAEGDIDALEAAVGNDESGLVKDVADNAAAIKAIADDYLKADDKYDDTQIKADIKANADAIDAIEADYLKAADKYDDTALQGRVKTIEDDYLKAADKKALQDQIDLIMNNPDTENVINSISEFTEYITEHGEIAEGFRTDIDANADAIDVIEADYLKAADKTELSDAIALKADASAFDTLKGRVDVIEPKAHEHSNRAELDKIADGDVAKWNAAEQNAKDYADGLDDATREYVGTIPSNYTESNVIAYINKKAEETLNAANSGSSESAASVAQALETYKAQNDPKVAKNTEDIGEINEKLDGVESGAEVNIIEAVKVNGSALTPDENRAVNVVVPTSIEGMDGYTALGGRVDAAKSVADSAAAKAEENAGLIGGHETRIAANESAKADHLARIIALENADTQHAAEYSALSEIVSGHTESIAQKAAQADLDAAVARVAANETAIGTLNNTTVPALQEAIGQKAASADVYTKAEVGEIAEGKTLVKMIEDAAKGVEYDDSEVRGLISAEETRAKGVEEGLEGRLAEVETFFAAVETPDAVIDTLAEIVSYIESDKSGASQMAADIKANADAIAAINHEESGILALAKDYTDEQIAGLPAATASALGLVKYDDKTIKMNEEKQLYVAEVSTDLLVMGSARLVLDGGNATQA